MIIALCILAWWLIGFVFGILLVIENENQLTIQDLLMACFIGGLPGPLMIITWALLTDKSFFGRVIYRRKP